KATGRRMGDKMAFDYDGSHPVGGVSWESAKAFCEWLTARERSDGRLQPKQGYRLPSDHEWSCAVGLVEDAALSPEQKSGKIDRLLPWGTEWPPPPGAGNLASEELKALHAEGKHTNKPPIPGYWDGYGGSAPVGSYAANRFGLFDMGTNITE